ncbi:MAG: hypothetical protein PHV06_11095, partial [bacterium]|nr:hypothetical protein [bacterium]
MKKSIFLILLFSLLSAVPGFGMTLTSINIDGDIEDWSPVMLDPDNFVSDPIKDFGDLDTPTIVQSGRDVTSAALTWDDTYLYFLIETNTIVSNICHLIFYIDVNYDLKMTDSDKVVRFVFNNTQKNSYIYDYVPFDAVNGDPLPNPGDGQSMPGSVTSQVETNYLFEKGPNMIRVEMSVPWTDLGVTEGSPVSVHVSSGRGDNLPSQVEDNLNLVITMFAALDISPNNFGSTSVGGSVIYSHVISNLGNDTDTFNISTSGTLNGWTAGLFIDSGCTLPLTDSNGDLIPDTGDIASGDTFTLYVKITSKATANAGTVDRTYINLASTNDPDVSDSAFDETVVGDVTLFPDSQGYSTPGDFIVYPLTIKNNGISPRIFNITTSGTRAGWTIGFYYDYACTSPLIDNSGDGIIDTGSLNPGTSLSFYIKLIIPGSEVINVTDSTLITATATDNNKIKDGTSVVTQVSNSVLISPDQAGVSGTNSFLFFTHSVQNNHSYSNTVNLQIISFPAGWIVKLYENDGIIELTDHDGDSNPDIPDMPLFGEPYFIKVRVYIPSGVAEGMIGDIQIRASISGITDDATDTITVHTLNTYSAATYVEIKSIFTIGDTVYAKASGLTVSKVVLLWYDNTPTLVYTSPEIQVNASGIAKNQYTPLPGNKTGDWVIHLYESKNGAPTGSILSTVYINVGEIASSSDKLKLFPSWAPEDNRIAFISETTAMNNTWHIYTLDLTTLTETKLTDTNDVASLSGINTPPEIIHYSKIDWDPDSGPASGRIIFSAIDKDDVY